MCPRHIPLHCQQPAVPSAPLGPALARVVLRGRVALAWYLAADPAGEAPAPCPAGLDEALPWPGGC